MNVSKERIAFLVKAYTNNNISSEEMKELSEATEQLQEESILGDLMEEHWNTLAADDQLEVPKDKIYSQIISAQNFKDTRKHKGVISLHRFKRYSAYAAVIIILLGIGVAFFFNQNKKENVYTAQNKLNNIPSQDSKKAILTLADGRRIVLEDANSTAMASKENLTLDQKNGQLVYHQQDGFLPVAGTEENAMITPRGGEYQLVLPDGTKVWLNTASTLTYPVVFGGKERRVKINGEAYFEVAKHKTIPFIVEANGTEVQVMGTHFNVSAYADDSFIRTTLMEGAVKVSGAGGQAILKPNQQATINSSSGSIEVKNVDTEQAMAWKNGYFMFRNEDIRTVMKVISRWYDIDVEYKGELKGKTFGGTISKFASINDLLKAMALTNAIHFENQGRSVIVMP